MKFSIYRFNPDVDKKPYMQDYDVVLEDSDQMLLDALLRIKDLDDSLSLRKSCREGVCGSDSMNINGKNGLACITKLSDLEEPVVLRPMPGLPVIRDLVVDMTQFFENYNSVKPYLVTTMPRLPPSACNRRPIGLSWMASTNAYCAVRAPHLAHHSGGTRINLSAQPA